MDSRTISTAQAAGTPKLPSLRRQFAWTLTGNAVYAACQWAILAVIARMSDVRAVGQFALGLAVTAPVFLLAGMQLRGVQATDASAQFRFRDYLTVRIVGMLTGLAVSAALIWQSGYDSATSAVVMLVGLTKAIEGVSDACYGALQQHERMDAISRSLMIRGALSVTAIAVVLWRGNTLAYAVAAMGAAWLTVALLHDLPAVAALDRNSESPEPWPQAARLRRIIVLAFPLGIVLALISLRTNIPRYFLERSAGTSDLGVYAALSSLVIAGNLVISALGQSATPRLAKYHFQGNRSAFRRLVWILVAIGAAVGVCGFVGAWAVGRPLLCVLFGATYAQHVPLLLLLMLAGAFAYVASFLGFALTATRQFNAQLPLFGVSAGLCFLASVAFVPRYGLFGAAAAWLVAVIFEMVAAGTLLRRVVSGSRIGRRS